MTIFEEGLTVYRTGGKAAFVAWRDSLDDEQRREAQEQAAEIGERIVAAFAPLREAASVFVESAAQAFDDVGEVLASRIVATKTVRMPNGDDVVRYYFDDDEIPDDAVPVTRMMPGEPHWHATVHDDDVVEIV